MTAVTRNLSSPQVLRQPSYAAPQPVPLIQRSSSTSGLRAPVQQVQVLQSSYVPAASSYAPPASNHVVRPAAAGDARSSMVAPPGARSSIVPELPTAIAMFPGGRPSLATTPPGILLPPSQAPPVRAPAGAAQGPQLVQRSSSTPSLRSPVPGGVPTSIPFQYTSPPGAVSSSFAPPPRLGAADGTVNLVQAVPGAAELLRVLQYQSRGSGSGSPRGATGRSSPGRSSPRKGEDSLSAPKGKPRYSRLYEDALARRQRLQEKKDAKEKAVLREEEASKQNAWIKQRQRQSCYRFKDNRTHEEREEALLKRREDRSKARCLEKMQLEAQQFDECTFHPRLLGRGQDGRYSGAILPHERASSCSGVAGYALQDGSFHESPRDSQFLESPRGSRFNDSMESPGGVTSIQRHLWEHQALVASLNDIAAETELACSARSAQVQGEHDLRLYKQNLEVVHALECLDMQVLELPQAHFNLLLMKGYRLGLGEKGRRGLTSANSAVDVTQNDFAESPRNNLRQDVTPYFDSPEAF